MISIGLFAGSLFLTTAGDPTTFGTGSALLKNQLLLSPKFSIIFIQIIDIIREIDNLLPM